MDTGYKVPAKPRSATTNFPLALVDGHEKPMQHEKCFCYNRLLTQTTYHSIAASADNFWPVGCKIRGGRLGKKFCQMVSTEMVGYKQVNAIKNCSLLIWILQKILRLQVCLLTARAADPSQKTPSSAMANPVVSISSTVRWQTLHFSVK